MGLIKSVAPCIFAVSMIAFGIQHFVYGAFVTRVIPNIPAWFPPSPAWAYAAGAILIAAGAAILLRKQARAAAFLLGCLLVLSFLVLYVPSLLATPPLSGLWTNAGKALAMAGGAFLIAAASPRTGDASRAWPRWNLVPLIPLSRVFVGAFLFVAGVQHFLFAPFVATLVPGWIPGHLFWTYFAGAALIAGGLGILIPKVTRPAALLSGTMILLWVVLLHIPRAWASPRSSNEMTAVFEALAIGSAALLIAVVPLEKTRRE